MTAIAISGLVQAPVLRTASASSGVDSLSLKTKEIMKSIKPTRKGERFAEVYVRLDSHLPMRMKADLAPLLANKGNTPAADVRISGNELVFVSEKAKLTVLIEETPTEIMMKVNGKALAASDFETPKKLFSTLEKIIRKEAAQQKNARFWPLQLLVPEAQAFLDGGWGSILLTAGVGLLAFWGGKKYGESQAASAAPACTSNRCCQVGTTYQIGCCFALGGMEVAVASHCPVGQSIPGAATATGTLNDQPAAPSKTLNGPGTR